MTARRLSLVLGLALISGLVPAQAQPSLEWFLVDGIHGVSGQGQIELVGTISAEDASFASRGNVSVHSVFDVEPSFFGGPFEPRLRISHETNHVIISWNTLSPSNQIESAASLLGPSTTWTNVTQPPVVQNGRFELILPASASPRFFRLRLN
jgi:hypothetical protein